MTPKADDRWYFDEAAAAKACAFFENFLRHSKGEFAGQAFQLAEWQRRDIVRPLFGWKEKGSGLRRYREAWIEIPRKNGKSTIAAGLGILLFIGDGEPGAEVYSVASDIEQAAIVFREAQNMIAASPELRKVTESFKKAITCPELGAAYRLLSSDAGTKHGLNPHGVVFDEVHTQPNRDLIDTMHTAVGARRQPLEVFITTAGASRHTIAWEKHDYAVKVRDGVIDDPRLLVVIYAADPDDDWTDPKVWAKANPGLGVSIKEDYIRAECEKAQTVPGYENTFRRLHLNQWTEQVTRWLPMDRWDNGAGTVPWTDLPALLRGREAYAGLDLSTTTDITALVLYFPPDAPDEPGFVVPKFFVPEENIRRRVERDRVPYDLWAREGALIATEGNIVDYERVRAEIQAAGAEFDLRELAYDRWNATQLATELQEDGLTMVPFGQGFKDMSPAAKELERLVVGGLLAHGGHPVLRWMASNVAKRDDPAGNIKPDKSKSGEKIDGVVAACMAIGRACVATELPPSAYAGRGLLMLG